MTTYSVSQTGTDNILIIIQSSIYFLMLESLSVNTVFPNATTI